VRILLLNQFYPPDQAPTGVVLHDLARTLAARGHDVTVFCSRHSYNSKKTFPKHEILNGVKVVRLWTPGLDSRTFLAKFGEYASFYVMLFTSLVFHSPRPDLVCSLSTPPFLGVLGRLAAQAGGYSHMNWVMDVYPDVLAAYGTVKPRGVVCEMLRDLAAFQYSSAHLVLTLGSHMSERVGNYVSEKSTLHSVPLWGGAELIPWPGGELNPFREKRGWRKEDFVLMYSGNMGRGHRLQEFLCAAQQLGTTGPLWAFAGGGKRREEIERFAAVHPEVRVSLLPYADSGDLRASLCAADVHLVSQDSAWQGLIVPSKLQSSFCLGKPVIFVGGRQNEIAECIQDSGGGWIVPENDIAALLRAVSEAGIAEERSRRGKAALEYAQRNFRLKQNCEKIARLIEGITH
jgi:colanic acid biosynthesis glycosyl transferase WcaI